MNFDFFACLIRALEHTKIIRYTHTEKDTKDDICCVLQVLQQLADITNGCFILNKRFQKVSASQRNNTVRTEYGLFVLKKHNKKILFKGSSWEL